MINVTLGEYASLGFTEEPFEYSSFYTCGVGSSSGIGMGSSGFLAL